MNNLSHTNIAQEGVFTMQLNGLSNIFISELSGNSEQFTKSFILPWGMGNSSNFY